MTQLVKLRSELRAACLERGIKLSYMPFIVKVAESYFWWNSSYFLLFSFPGLLTGPPALPHLEQHIGRPSRHHHLQGVAQHCPGHGHPHGPAGAQHQGSAGPFHLWDCHRVEQAAATWQRWQTINIRPLWRHLFSQVSSWKLSDILYFISFIFT